VLEDSARGPRVLGGYTFPAMPIRRRKATVYDCECRFCGWKWTSLGPKVPTRCARCKKLNFDKPPTRQK